MVVSGGNVYLYVLGQGLIYINTVLVLSNDLPNTPDNNTRNISHSTYLWLIATQLKPQDLSSVGFGGGPTSRKWLSEIVSSQTTRGWALERGSLKKIRRDHPLTQCDKRGMCKSQYDGYLWAPDLSNYTNFCQTMLITALWVEQGALTAESGSLATDPPRVVCTPEVQRPNLL